MTAVFLFARLCLLVGCAAQSRKRPTAHVDLVDMSTVQEIRSQLNAEEGAAFANYVVTHHIKSSSFSGQLLVRPKGKPPVTIGEAIELTLAKDTAERRAAEMGMDRPGKSFISSSATRPKRLQTRIWRSRQSPVRVGFRLAASLLISVMRVPGVNHYP